MPRFDITDFFDRKYLPEKSFDKIFCFSICFTFTLGIILLIYLSSSFGLEAFPDRAMGLYAIDGTFDPRKRRTLYYVLLFTFFIVFYTSMLIISKLIFYTQNKNYLQKSISIMGCMGVLCSYYLFLISPVFKIFGLITFCISLFCIISYFINWAIFEKTNKLCNGMKEHPQNDNKEMNPIIIKNLGLLAWLGVFLTYALIFININASYQLPLIIFAGCTIGWLGVSILQSISAWRFSAVESSMALLQSRTIFCFFVYTAILFIFNTIIYSSPIPLFAGSSVNSSVLIGAIIIISWITAGYEKVWPIVLSFRWLTFSLIAFFIAQIAQWVLSEWHIFTSKEIFYAFVCVLLIVSFCDLYRTKGNHCVEYFIKWQCIPSILLGVLLLKSNLLSPMVLSTNDLLHPGNWIVPAQQIMQFGLVPYLDFWPGQGLQFSILPSIYAFITSGNYSEFLHTPLANGFPNLFFRGASVPLILTGCLVYYLLIRYMHPLLALGCLLIFPIDTYYGICLLGILCVPWAIERFSYFRLLITWGVTFLIFALMPSAGKAIALSLFGILLMYSLSLYKERLKIMLLSFILVFSAGATMYIALLILNGHNIFDIITLIKSYAIRDALTGSYATIAPSFSILAVWYYVITPTVCIAVIVYTIIYRTKLTSVAVPMWTCSALAMCTLMLLVRALARHSLVESYNPFFFYLMLFSLSSLPIFKNILWRQIFIISIAIIALQMNFSPFSRGIIIAGGNITIEDRSVSTQQASKLHVKYDEDEEQLVTFLRKNLNKEETFVEFINGHLLFFLAGKKNPLFHQASLVITSESAQQVSIEQLEEFRRKGEIPFAILNGPYWGAKVDNLYETMRLYKISEYFYKKYMPYATVGGYEIWADKDSRFAQKVNTANETIDGRPLVRFSESLGTPKAPSFYDLDLSPEIIGNTLHLKAGVKDPMINNIFAITATDPFRIEQAGQYLRVKYKNSTPGSFQIFYSINGQPYKGEVSGTALAFISGYAYVPLPSTITYPFTLSEIRIDPPNGSSFAISGIDLFNGKPASLPGDVQFYNFGKVPYLWANYDERQAINNSVRVRVAQDINIQPYNSFTKYVGDYNDLGDGEYLHLKVIAPNGGLITGHVAGVTTTGTFTLSLLPSASPENYLVRISSLYAWTQKDRNLVLFSDNNIKLLDISVLVGD